jgi:prepilin-type N-terminal cleavage/methylation domain-containing protein
MNAQTQKTNGFTIIEVVLVLAIAALIFLMIFVALPALQRGQANTARKNDANIIAGAVTSYRTNTNGSLPTTYDQLTSYIDNLSQIVLPATGTIPTGAGTLTADASTLDTAVVYARAKCSGSAAVSGSNKQAVVLTVVQNSANGYATVCVNT